MALLQVRIEHGYVCSIQKFIKTVKNISVQIKYREFRNFLKPRNSSRCKASDHRVVSLGSSREANERTNARFPEALGLKRRAGAFSGVDGVRREIEGWRGREREREICGGRKAERGSKLSLTTPRRFAAQEALSDLRL